MLWFLLIGCLFILVLSGILIYRTLIQHQLDQVKIPNDGATKKFKRKLAFLKQKETSKHVMYLIIWGMGVQIFLLFMMVSFYIAETNRTNEMATLKAEVTKLKTEQQYLIEKTDYPIQGLGFSDANWKGVMSGKDSKKIKENIEQTITEKLTPYIGLPTVVLFIDSPTQSISLSVTTEEAGENRNRLKKTIEAFVKELQGVDVISQVQFELVKSKEEQANALYTAIYVREEAGQEFKLMLDSDEKAKEDKKDKEQ
ncbi:hypothetical protein BAU15_03580 [Enterococcus sp. JM4C]|uniref:hypothetical protein n=1 Tax=Candidatus Enterococcus huntleyi TaxID=1857217 RepID=UPI00137B5BD2|nr:hypothetical protein [Enterococcus sp. JM4C]KAF1295633.1 hypothetical protein BAU15_03580 [Enterococcus sp. JM4C]